MGLLYFDANRPALHEDLNLIDTALSELGEEDLRPSPEALEKVVASLRG
jgi:hypothetical protein